MKILVYSHDTFGLGNIRRMLTICQYLLDNLPNLSILLISGSPVLHRLRLPQGLDYIKLPCVGRDETGEMSVTYLGGNTQEMSQLRSDLILTAVFNFQPDLILVDKKPYGIQGELKATLHYLKEYHLPTKLVLLLRDILDSPEPTIKEWCALGNYQALEHFYEQVLVVGTPEIFDVIEEYQFPYTLAAKVKFCGYIQRDSGLRSREEIVRKLNIQSQEKLVFVTSGGGADGAKLLETYLASLSKITEEIPWKTLILMGTEMPLNNQQKILQMASQFSQVIVEEFSDDINSYFNAADLVISMGGYNTVCEILSLRKRAIIVPRIKPVQEQWLRARKMAEIGYFKTIHPDDLTADLLLESLVAELANTNSIPSLDLEGLPQINYYLNSLRQEQFHQSKFLRAIAS